MRRSDFLTWGLELSAGDFARALAARGVLDAARSRVLIGSDPGDPLARLEEVAAVAAGLTGGGPLTWELSPERIQPISRSSLLASPGPPARVLADAWRDFIGPVAEPRHPIQLEVLWPSGSPAGAGDPLWLLRELGRPEVGAASVYLRADLPVGDASWQWPLRVGTLAGPVSEVLRVRLETAASLTEFVGRLSERIVLDPGAAGPEECDLLLLPEALPQALATVLSLPRPPVPDAAVVLGAAWRDDATVAAQLAALRASMPCSGMALAPVAEGEIAGWFRELMTELSRDRSLDRALFAASRATGSPVPVLFFARRLVAFSRVSERVRELADRLASPEVRGRSLDIPDEGYLHHRLAFGGRHLAGELARRLRDLPATAYDREVDMASAAAEIEELMGRELRPRSSATRRPARRPGTFRAMEGTPEPSGERATKVGRGGEPEEKEGWSEESQEEELEPGTKATPDEDTEEAPREPVERAEEAAPPDAPRFLQGRVLDAAAPEPRRPLAAFRAGGDHEIQVRVGRAEEGWLKPVSGQAFPVHELPKDRCEHELTVVFSEPSLLPVPRVAKIVLPRVGDSSLCAFPLHVPVDTDRVTGRIVVHFKNRVLQTALLTGRALADPSTARGVAPEERIRVEVEAVVRPNLGELDGRRSFDAALVLNHDAAGTPGVLKLAGEHATVEVLPDIDRLIRWFDDKLSGVAYDKQDFREGLEAPATVTLLRDLARYGAELYEHLVEDQWGTDDPLVHAERLQVISAHAKARFPIELVYERPVPRKDAGLCPHAAEALRGGRCSAVCPSDLHSYVCPLGFWGVSRVIERHAHDPKLAKEVRRESADFALQAEPVEGRRSLEVLGPSLVAASQRVETSVPGEWKTLQGEVGNALGVPTHTASTWQKWVQAVSADGPRLHLLLVHTDRVAAGDPMQKMEIGQASWLAVADLEEAHVRFPIDHPPPLVILLGCETGAPEISFLSFPAKLRRKGAAIVVCSQSTIHALHAVPVAQGLVSTLRRQLDAGETPFGEVMRIARRELLADGLPMVLCLIAFGDADWRLVAEAPEP